MADFFLNLLFEDNRSVLNAFGSRKHILKRLLGDRIIDILFHLPTGVINHYFVNNLDKKLLGEYVTVPLVVHEHVSGKRPYRIVCSCNGVPLEILFFTIKKRLIDKAFVGRHIIISGVLRLSKDSRRSSYAIIHPGKINSFQEVGEKKSGPEPIYPLTAGIQNPTVSIFIQKIMDGVFKESDTIPEWIPQETLKKFGWPNWKDAIKEAHHPNNEKDLTPFSPARGRLIYDELLAYQLGMLAERVLEDKRDSVAFTGHSQLQQKLIDRLPFQLTPSQRDALEEINNDMAMPFQMLRLMQGDVGSGKTIVALLAALKAIEGGHQAAILVPTDILSRQHYQTIKNLLEPLNLRTAILTGREKGKVRKEILHELESGHIHLLVGTHALIQDTVTFHKLGLVVIDEQHRFGVQQRARLSEKGVNPHILTMTATPIPRTLSIAQYGDMDMSCIWEKPACRIETETCVMSVDKIDSVIKALSRVLKKKEKIFWVCALIEESEDSNLTPVIERHMFLQEHFKGKVGLVHGRLSSVEKEEIMEEFVNGSIDILVATTVIEVGVHVPQASVMVVENSERFGLAQLHQLRGRIGRGNMPSTCILLYDSPLGLIAKKRLITMRNSNDGFFIAEADLKLRGRGEVLGTRQSGMPKFRMCTFDVEKEEEYEYLSELLAQAQQDARRILKHNPTLDSKAVQSLLGLFKTSEGIKLKRAG